jgi:hypothetical protein
MYAGLTRWLPVLAALMGVAGSAGCGASSHAATGTTQPPANGGTAASAPVPSAWRVVEGAGFTVEFQSGWVSIDPATLANPGAMHRMEKANPGLNRTFRALAEIVRQPGVLVALDRTAAGRRVGEKTGFAPNIMVRVWPLASLAPDAQQLTDVMAAGRKNASTLGNLVGTPATTRLRLGGLPARGVTYSFRENTDAGRQLVTESDYVTVRQGTAFMIFCASVHSDLSRLRPVCARALSSFAFTD